MKNSAVVIGAGFGGLAAAVRLQSAGWDVKLIEQRELVGGRAYQFKQAGYTFDMGPSLVTVPELIEGVFSAASRKLEDYLDLMPLDPFYRIYYHDGTDWQPLETRLDPDENYAIAPTQDAGLYVLMSSLAVPLNGPGWNNFYYPAFIPQTVDAAVASISGQFTTVCGYLSVRPKVKLITPLLHVSAQLPQRTHSASPICPSVTMDLTSRLIGHSFVHLPHSTHSSVLA